MKLRGRVMKILYIHQYYRTPEEGGSIRSYYLSTGLVENGYEVEMITSHNEKLYVQKTINGVRVHYLPVYYDNHLGFLRRIISFFRFYYQAVRLAKNIEDVNLVYAMTTPLTVGLIAMKLKRDCGLPYYFEVGDLWPEAPIQMGFVKNRLAKAWLYRLEKRIYDNAEKLIALSPPIRNYIEKTAPGKKVYLIPNMSDVEYFQPHNNEKEHLGKFVISYFGAVGKANHLEYLLEAALLCQNQLPQVGFNVMGYGSELDRLISLSQKVGIENIEFIEYGNKSKVKQLLDRSDAVYVSFASHEVLNTGSPNKFFDALAAGKLVIINFEGWLKELVETHECGLAYDPEYPEEFIEKLDPYLSDRKKLIESQSRSRQLAEVYYSKELQINKLLKLLNNEHHLGVIDSEVYILTA